jgi:hypothetical protein
MGTGGRQVHLILANPGRIPNPGRILNPARAVSTAIAATGIHPCSDAAPSLAAPEKRETARPAAWQVNARI